MFKDFVIPFVAFLLGTFLGNVVTFYNKSRELQDSLDTRSNWRINLVNISSKEFISIDDVYRIRTSLRNVKHNPIELEIYSFDFMTNVMINICDDTISKYSRFNIKRRMVENEVKKTYILDKKDSEIIRICCRFLLKHHWEYLSKGYKNPLIRKIKFNSTINNNAESVCKEIERIGGIIKYE